MKSLQRLLISDLKRSWRQGIAISAVLASGVATFVMSTSTIRSLDATREAYYRDYAFGDVFVQVTRAPKALIARMEKIPGVAKVQTRVVRDGIVDAGDMLEPVTCRIVSIPDSPASSLNRVHLSQGRMPTPNHHDEVIASDAFAKSHRWRPGTQVNVTLGGRKRSFKIVGLGMSPEFIYAVQPGLLLADHRRFGVFWMPDRQLAAAFNMEGAFNDAVLSVVPRSSLADILFRLDRLTEPYGGRAAYTRADQSSHRRVSDEMHQLRGMAVVSPSIFLAVAAFLFNIMLSRMVLQQREQIATLRAFGYRPWEIGWHYSQLVMVLAAAGAIVGCWAGFSLAEWMTRVYVQFFRFPAIEFRVAYDQAAIALAVSLAAAIGGGASAIRRAMTLQPAVAMRPDAPTETRDSIFERLGLRGLMSPVVRMIVRRLELNLRATALSILGMACAVAILMLGTFMGDTIDYVLDVQFQKSQRQDVMLTFNDTLSPNAIHDLRHLPGVSRGEVFRAVPVRLRHGTRHRMMSLMGLEERPQLFRVLDEQVRDVPLDGPNLTISKKLAELLQVGPGSRITVELLDGSRQKYVAKIGRVFPDYTDPGAYLSRRVLHRMLREGARISGAFLSVDPQRLPDFYAEVKRTPTVASVLVKAAAIQNFHDTIAANLRPMRLINGLFAFVIAFGVIYNCALITLSERSRDLATLRVMGFDRWEVSRVLLGELAIITLVAIPIGLPLGYVFCYLATLALDTETHRFPLIVQRATFAYASTVIILSATLSSLFVRRMLDRLDLIAVLKAKE